jgi:hypothetical protein
MFFLNTIEPPELRLAHELLLHFEHSSIYPLPPPYVYYTHIGDSTARLRCPVASELVDFVPLN